MRNTAVKTPTDENPAQGPACPIRGGILRWEYQCQDCRATFDVAVPKGPKAERAIVCTTCGSRRIERINVPDLTQAACGG
jgi:DNA-directed RNA polymerase subunit RPC12/RpoP